MSTDILGSRRGDFEYVKGPGIGSMHPQVAEESEVSFWGVSKLAVVLCSAVILNNWDKNQKRVPRSR